MQLDEKDIIEQVRLKQRMLQLPKTNKPIEHKPEMLLIGCIDARVNPIDDLGILKGKALIFRNPGALVRPYMDKGEDGGNRTMAGTLEFAVDAMKVKHVTVMGHTHCGAINACHCGVDKSKFPNLTKYFKPLLDLVGLKNHSHDDEEVQLRFLEQEGVKESVKNLMTYPMVEKAVSEGRIKLHGWVIDIVTHRISEYDPATDQFVPMVPPPSREGARSA